jgi:MFS family permease
MVAVARRPADLPVSLASRGGIYYGWIVVAVTFVVLLVSAGIRQVPAVILKPLENEFHWDRASISLAISVGLFLNGLASPFAGKLMDRYGVRSVMLAAIVLVVASCLSTIVMISLPGLMLFYGVGVGIGSGALSVVMGAAIANRWFVKRRGLVTGVLGAGFSAGQLVFVQLMTALTISIDWRAAFLFMTVMLAVMLPLAWVFMRSTPAEVGLAPYGATSEQQAQALSGPTTSIGQAVRTLDFWLLAGSFFVCGFTTAGTVGTHFMAHAVEHGFDPYTAGFAFSLIGGMNFIGTTASGYLTDRFNPRILLSIYYGLRATSLLMLPFISDVVGLTVFAIIFGLDFIATVPPTIGLTADRFGRRSVAQLFGWITFAHQIGGAIAASLSGWIHDLFGDYQIAFLAAAMLGFIAAGIALRIAPKKWPEPAPAVA